MESIKATNEQVINDILAGGVLRMKAIQAIYQNLQLKNMVIAYVQKNQGRFEDGQDIFHDGIIILDQNIRNGKFRGDAPIEGYLYSICRFAWMNRLRKEGRTIHTDEPPLPADAEAVHTPEGILLDEERRAVLARLMETIGERCSRILELWKLSFSMEEIAEKLGYSSAGMARKAKHRCHVALLEQIKTNPQWASLLRH